jgi:hypothetical protein
MKFIWGPKNLTHVLLHVSQEAAEGVALAEDLDAKKVDDQIFAGFGSYNGQHYFIAFMQDRSRSETYILTCYPKEDNHD